MLWNTTVCVSICLVLSLSGCSGDPSGPPVEVHIHTLDSLSTQDMLPPTITVKYMPPRFGNITVSRQQLNGADEYEYRVLRYRSTRVDDDDEVFIAVSWDTPDRDFVKCVVASDILIHVHWQQHVNGKWNRQERVYQPGNRHTERLWVQE